MARSRRRSTKKPGFWATKTVGEIMVLSITFTVCFGVLASGLTITTIAVFRPDVDITVWVSRITGLLNTMVGLLAGFLAGRTDAKTMTPPPPPPQEPQS